MTAADIIGEHMANTDSWQRYASEFARHIREGRVPSLSEAILIVGLAASVAAFLIEREQTP